ncbi:MAG: hypothetical protein M1457_03885 [bacterium]|nr:hypothetical protein [bacterium]
MNLFRTKNLRRLSAMLDGQLARRPALALARRLEKDDALRTEQKTWRDVDDLLRRWPEPAPLSAARREALAGAVMERTREDLAHGPGARWAVAWRPRAAVAAWALSGMLAGWILLSGLVSHFEARLDSETFVQEVQISMMLPLESAPFGNPGSLALLGEAIQPGEGSQP